MRKTYKVPAGLVLVMLFFAGCFSLGETEKKDSVHDGYLVEVSSRGRDLFQSTQTLSLGKERYTLEPLFPGRKMNTFWYKLKAVKPAGAGHHWDLTYELQKKIEKFSPRHHEHIIHIEPDILHARLLNSEQREAGADCAASPVKHQWPYPGKFAWHLDPDYSQLKAARDFVGNPPDNQRLRIAHLDTGYDPNQETLPLYMNYSLQRNFMPGEDPTDAAEPYDVHTPFAVTGHGTGTLSLYAGNHIQWPYGDAEPEFDDFLGAAPFQEIVVVRFSNTVVHFYTSGLARAIMYAADTDCAVATLSHGGVASDLWADAVNEAYEAGTAVFAASGDRLGITLPSTTVYPARFDRVVAVFATTSGYTPYYTANPEPMFELMGTFGPESVMWHTIATYTPNVPWARFKCPHTINLDGGGTSAATPQAAGAAALWLQLNGGHYEKGWQTVEAVRTALFNTADKSRPESGFYYGQGLLKARDALDYVPQVSELKKAGEATVYFPFLTLVWEYIKDPFPEPEKKMFSVEIAQLHLLGDLHKIISDPHIEKIPLDKLKAYVKGLHDSPQISRKLKGVLAKVLGNMP